MGNWIIVIRGEGQFGNSDDRADADHLAAETIMELRATGHKNVIGAFITSAGVHDFDAPVIMQVPEPQSGK